MCLYIGGIEMEQRRSFGGGQGFSPVKVDEELDVKIEAVGEKGDGIAKVKGFVLFVPGVKQGDEVKIRVTKVLRNVGFAEVIGQSTGVPQEQADSNEEQQAEQPAEEEYKDSEDFGEEQPSEEPSSDEAQEEENQE